VVAATAPVDALPLVASDPLQPADAVHALALLVLQVRVEVPPAATVDGVAPSVTLGALEGGGEVLPVPEPEPEEQAPSTRLASNNAENRHFRAVQLHLAIIHLVCAREIERGDYVACAGAAGPEFPDQSINCDRARAINWVKFAL
jgi:hypothetical protein